MINKFVEEIDKLPVIVPSGYNVILIEKDKVKEIIRKQPESQNIKSDARKIFIEGWNCGARGECEAEAWHNSESAKQPEPQDRVDVELYNISKEILMAVNNYDENSPTSKIITILRRCITR